MFSLQRHIAPCLILISSGLVSSCKKSSPEVTWSVPSEIWSANGFAFPEDLSGIASADGQHALVITDEACFVQSATIDAQDKALTARNTYPLLPEIGKGKLYEIDAEGVTYATDRSTYYLIGSHGLGKKKGDAQPERSLIFSLPYDHNSQAINTEGIRKSSLMPHLRTFPELTPFIEQPLQQNGLNIEGLAYAEGMLFVGLRAPNLEGNAVIIECDPTLLFDQGTIAPLLHKAAVGRGRGIREIVALKHGFLLLTGNASAEASKKFPQSQALADDSHFEILYWHPDQGNRTKLLAALPVNGGKAEGMLVMQESAQWIELMILHDSMPGGAPTIIHLTHPLIEESTESNN
jgi:hypothetical protein